MQPSLHCVKVVILMTRTGSWSCVLTWPGSTTTSCSVQHMESWFCPTNPPLEHVSLAKVGTSLTNSEKLIEVESTKTNLLSVGSAVSVGQPVLLPVEEVGVGKTSLVLEWGAGQGGRF